MYRFVLKVEKATSPFALGGDPVTAVVVAKDDREAVTKTLAALPGSGVKRAVVISFEEVE